MYPTDDLDIVVLQRRKRFDWLGGLSIIKLNLAYLGRRFLFGMLVRRLGGSLALGLVDLAKLLTGWSARDRSKHACQISMCQCIFRPRARLLERRARVSSIFGNLFLFGKLLDQRKFQA